MSAIFVAIGLPLASFVSQTSSPLPFWLVAIVNRFCASIANAILGGVLQLTCNG